MELKDVVNQKIQFKTKQDKKWNYLKKNIKSWIFGWNLRFYEYLDKLRAFQTFIYALLNPNV